MRAASFGYAIRARGLPVSPVFGRLWPCFAHMLIATLLAWSQLRDAPANQDSEVAGPGPADFSTHGFDPTPPPDRKQQSHDATDSGVLAREFKAYLDGLETLVVRSEQRIQGLKLTPLPQDQPVVRSALLALEQHPQDVIAVDLVLTSTMTAHSFALAIWDEASPRNETIFDLQLREHDSGGSAMLVERHWYPRLQRYRTVAYESPHPKGCFDLALRSGIAGAVPGGTCATAEFFLTWLGGSPQAEQFESIISDGVVQGEEVVGQVPSTRVERATYLIEDQDTFYSRCDVFWLNSTTGLLVGWQTQLVAITFGDTAAYQVVDRSYSYMAVPETPAPVNTHDVIGELSQTSSQAIQDTKGD